MLTQSQPNNHFGTNSTTGNSSASSNLIQKKNIKMMNNSNNSNNSSINNSNNSSIHNYSTNQSINTTINLTQTGKSVPSIKQKTNELFYKWLSEPERTEQLKEVINLIRNSNRIPKITELKSFKNDPIVTSNKLILTRQLNDQYGSNSINNQFLNNQHQLLNNNQLGSNGNANNNNNNSNILRSKSPPSIHSPPMSPISRMPQSPKSPRQRHNQSNTSTSSSQQQQQQQQQLEKSQKSIMIFNKDQRSQSPTGSLQQPVQSNEEYLNNSLNNLKIQTSSSTPLSKLGQKQQPPQSLQQQQQQQQSKNEKEIQIQRISSSSPSSSTNLENESPEKHQQLIQQQQQQQLSLLNKQQKQIDGSPNLNGKGGLVSQNQSDLSSNNNQQLNYKNLNSPSQAAQTLNKTPTSNLPTTSPSKLSLLNKQKINVPQFYYPNGKPEEKGFKCIDDTDTMKLINAEFKQYKDGKMNKDEFAEVLKLLGLPKYWKILLFRTCNSSSKLNYVTYSVFEQTWSKLSSNCFDRVSLFMKLISTNNHIIYEDWEPLLQDIVDSHPGLKFLHDHKEFHTRYIKTVIARIYYTVNRSWSGKITSNELRRSNFLTILENLELEDDINLIKDYFSYEHFYVIYCKFWELDKDHDLYISKEDLYRHNNYSISPKVIDRIFSGTVIRSRDWREGLMSYYDFVWFLISEEDKRNPTSIEYWFRVLDLDGDGVLSMFELEYFYNEQIEQMRERQIEYMPFTDLLCQMLDMVKPLEHGKIRLKDLKQCKMANVFFDTFINLEKYLEYEQRDPFSNMRDLEGPEQSDWEKYATYEYENLVSEDVNGENQDMYNNYDDDFEDEPLMFNNQSVNAINTNGGLN